MTRSRAWRDTLHAAAAAAATRAAAGGFGGLFDFWSRERSAFDALGATRAGELDGRSPRVLCEELALNEDEGCLGVGARRGKVVDISAEAGLVGDRVAFDAVDWRS